MQPEPFALERYFARHEFSARYLLSSSDCEALGLNELLAFADENTRDLWDGLRLGYTESSGHPRLREAIAELYLGLADDDVLVLAPEEGIYLLMHALLRPGDHVVTTFPGYQSLYSLAEAIGCRVARWQPDEAAGWRFDLGDLTALLEPQTRLVVINFPHNPTGATLSEADFRALVALLQARGITLLSDEMYRYLEYMPASTLPAACALYDRAVSLGGLSKSFGLPGLRIGWLASRDQELLRRIQQLKDYTTICSSAPSEILALIALQNRQNILETQKKRASGTRARLVDFMNSYQHVFTWQPPAGSSVCFPRMKTVTDTLAFSDRCVQETGIMLVPSRMFHYGDRHLRIGFGRANFPQGLAAFGKYLDQLFDG
jgi:aspartate/methionine/tyrosine aminotransferase